MVNYKMKKRRDAIRTISLGAASLVFSKSLMSNPIWKDKLNKQALLWQVGIGKRKITPTTQVWLAGFGYKRIPYGKIHDFYVKVLALKDANGKIAVLATTDNQGMSKTVYESI